MHIEPPEEKDRLSRGVSAETLQSTNLFSHADGKSRAA